jgi:hypothetical protein
MDLLIHCYQRPFANACGGEAGYWACEYERTAAAVYLPQCTSNCGSQSNFLFMRNSIKLQMYFSGSTGQYRIDRSSASRPALWNVEYLLIAVIFLKRYFDIFGHTPIRLLDACNWNNVDFVLCLIFVVNFNVCAASCELTRVHGRLIAVAPRPLSCTNRWKSTYGTEVSTNTMLNCLYWTFGTVLLLSIGMVFFRYFL